MSVFYESAALSAGFMLAFALGLFTVMYFKGDDDDYNAA